MSSTCGTFTCLKTGTVPKQTAGLSETYTHSQKGEKGEKEGVWDISTGLEIEQDWPRSEPVCLATCLVCESFQGSHVKAINNVDDTPPKLCVHHIVIPKTKTVML